MQLSSEGRFVCGGSQHPWLPSEGLFPLAKFVFTSYNARLQEE